MRPGFGNRRGRFLVSTEVPPRCPQSSPPLSPPESLRESSPSGSSSPTGSIPWLSPSSGLTPRPPDGQPSSERPARPPRLSPKGKQSPGHLAGEGGQNLAPPVTRSPPAKDSPRVTEKRKKSRKALAGKRVQEQHPSFIQTRPPKQQQQPLILQNPQPQQQEQFLPFPSLVQHPLIFQTQQQQQQFSPFPSFVPQFSPFSSLIFQTHPQMAFSFPSPQLQQQLPSLFQTPQPQQQQRPSIFQTSQPQPQQQNVQFQQQQHAALLQQQLMLFTEDGSPTSYNTRFVDLRRDSQKLLLRIEELILENRADSERLDQCIRLYDSSVSGDSFEFDASRILQELGGITTAIEREVSVQDLMKKVNDMMCHMEFAIHSYMMLRPRFLRPNVPAAAGIGSASQTVGAAGTSGQTNQLMTSSISPIFEFYSGIPTRPSKFVHHTAARFEKYMTECCQQIEELEQLVLMDTDKTSSNSLEALPKVMSNIHDYFIHVAAEVENLHRYVESMKMAYLADRRRWGDGNDPFLRPVEEKQLNDKLLLEEFIQHCIYQLILHNQPPKLLTSLPVQQLPYQVHHCCLQGILLHLPVVDFLFLYLHLLHLLFSFRLQQHLLNHLACLALLDLHLS
uniref:Nuclear pore complex protein Nup58 n=1 Tax=Elaeis guineensis var. tenera TaxID=51953 RepID=A0A6J0PCN4_ELAGV|nr:nuclear pore complex protein NUP58 [Elaeis guineensis]XP_019702674.1 nuclear pore complex protein NUP58 [Elaeis guineensis]